VAARHSAPYEGLYFISADRNTTCALLGGWLSCLALYADDGRQQPLLLAVSVDGTTLKPLRDGVAPPFTLGAPAGPGGRWTLRAPNGVALTRRSDPYLARIEEHLAGHVFVRLDTKSAPRAGDMPDYTKDTISMADSLIATVALEADQGCEHAVLFPDPTWNRSIPLAPAAPPPAAGQLGMRTFMLMKLELECAQAVDPRGPLDMRGMLGGVKLFAGADGEPVGLLLEGYMYAEIFVTRGATREAIGRMFTVMAAARGRQAE